MSKSFDQLNRAREGGQHENDEKALAGRYHGSGPRVSGRADGRVRRTDNLRFERGNGILSVGINGAGVDGTVTGTFTYDPAQPVGVGTLEAADITLVLQDSFGTYEYTCFCSANSNTIEVTNLNNALVIRFADNLTDVMDPILNVSVSGGPSGDACSVLGQPGCHVTGDAVPEATPLPAALPLFAGGLGVMGLLGWRRKRKNGAANAAA